MKEKDAAVIKVLADIGAIDEPELTPEQENQLKRALDPEEQFLHDVKRLCVNEDSGWDDWESEWEPGETKREYKNPLPLAPNDKLNHAWDILDDIENRAKKIYQQKHGDISNFTPVERMKIGRTGWNQYASMQDIPTSKVRASEPMLDGIHLNKLANNQETTKPSGEDIELFKMGDEYYVLDGNHRAAAAALRGDKTIRAKVIDTGR